MKPKPLPAKLSALIRVAVKDMKAMAKDKRYRWNAGTWHSPNGKCSVCMAGAVMRGSLGAKPSMEMMPSAFGARNAGALRALNAAREGAICSALGTLTVDITTYNRAAVLAASGTIFGEYSVETGKAPLRCYLKAADILERAGL